MEFTDKWKEVTLPTKLPKPLNELTVRVWKGRNETSILVLLGTYNDVNKALKGDTKTGDKIHDTVKQMLQDAKIIKDKKNWQSIGTLDNAYGQLVEKYKQVDIKNLYIISLSVSPDLLKF